MQAYQSLEGDILVNLSDEVDLDVGTGSQQKECNSAISVLLEFPKGKKISSEVESAVTLLLETGVCFQPDFFLLGPGSRMNHRIADQFVMRSPLGFSIVENLAPFGLFKSVERRKGEWKSYLRQNVLKVVAGFTMSIYGAEDLSQLPRDLIHELINTYRTTDGLRWRDDFEGSAEILTTSLRDFTRAMGDYCNDPELLEKARQTRMGASNTGRTWRSFVGNPTSLQAELLRYYEKYAETSLSRPKVDRQLLFDLDTLISGLGLENLHDAFLSGVPESALTHLYKSRKQVLTRGRLVSLRQAKRFCDFVLEELADEHPGKQFKAFISEREIKTLANDLGDRVAKRSEAAARPVAERFNFLIERILKEGASGWPGRTFRADVMINGKPENIYCPVLPTALLGMFRVPLRAVQFRRLDSGEGDLRRYNGRTKEWEANTALNAGYWFRTGLAKANQTRGYAHEFSDSDPVITGLYVNSNKTGEPYVIPWVPHDLREALWDLAEWQLKYNPVDTPVGPEAYLDEERPEATLKRLPDIFALFRMPPTARSPVRGVPPSGTRLYKAFLALMLEVEMEWNAINPDDQVTIITRYSAKGEPERCLYTLHGLRVRGITNLYLAGIPIEIISKIVAGHATVAMTLYYLKLQPAEISNRLSAAMADSNSAEVVNFINDLKNMKVAEAKRRTTYIDELAVEGLVGADKNLYCNVDIGVCPYDGARCDDGGPPIRVHNSEAGPKTKYGCIRKGARNCILCRHFISGTPFVHQLELYGTALLYRRNALSLQLQEHKGYLEDLYRQKDSGEISREAFRTRADRLRAENSNLKDDIEELDDGIFRVKLHLNAAAKIIKEDLAKGGQPRVALVANDRDSAIEYIEQTPFEIATILSQASRFWTILRDENVEKAKQQFVERIMWNSDLVPLSLRADLTEQERQKSSDLIAQFLIQQVSAGDRDALIEGRARLQDMKIEEQVQALLDQVSVPKFAMSPRPKRAIGRSETMESTGQ
ncbi:VPA1269 family protein [Rhizobium beringeri]|uniref:VPA1269 family protein n=1 Tax=Rhizobium beringeri TaxID=3019934 RepID=UPI002E119DFD|nr:VPA1269 family protein [Rhizobium beringeri]